MALESVVRSEVKKSWESLIKIANPDDSFLGNGTLEKIKRGVVRTLFDIQRKAYSDNNPDSLVSYFSEFSKIAYEEVHELRVDPTEVLSNLPTRTKTGKESFLEGTVNVLSMLREASSLIITASGAAVAGFYGYYNDSKIAGLNEIPGAVRAGLYTLGGAGAGYISSKLLLSAPLDYFKRKLRIEKHFEDKLFIEKMKKYILKNKEFLD